MHFKVVHKHANYVWDILCFYPMGIISGIIHVYSIHMYRFVEDFREFRQFAMYLYVVHTYVCKGQLALEAQRRHAFGTLASQSRESTIELRSSSCSKLFLKL